MGVYPGHVHDNGVIVSNHHEHGYGDKSGDVREVVDALYDYHNYKLVIDRSTQRTTGYLPCEVSSDVLGGDDKSWVLRVLQGAGFITIDDAQYNLDSGDWALVPIGKPFTLTGTVIQGQNLNVSLAAVKPE